MKRREPQCVGGIHPLIVMAHMAATTPPRKKYRRRSYGLSLTLVLFLCAAAILYFGLRCVI